MRNALQDQLLKAGLANDKQAKKASAEKRRETQLKQGNKAAAAAEELARQQLQRAQEEKAERDRRLNLQRNEAAAQKAVAAQIKQLVEAHRRPTGDGDTPYNFTDEGKVKSLRVSDEVRGQIVRGALAVVKQGDRYELVPAEIAEKIRARDPSAVVVDNAVAQSSAAGPDEDPYAQYQVPDDLIW